MGNFLFLRSSTFLNVHYNHNLCTADSIFERYSKMHSSLVPFSASVKLRWILLLHAKRLPLKYFFLHGKQEKVVGNLIRQMRRVGKGNHLRKFQISEYFRAELRRRPLRTFGQNSWFTVWIAGTNSSSVSKSPDEFSSRGKQATSVRLTVPGSYL